MAGTRILQTWAIEGGAVTIHVRSSTPLVPEAISNLTPVIVAIENFVSLYQPLPMNKEIEGLLP